jgi:hypothetical protein
MKYKIKTVLPVYGEGEHSDTIYNHRIEILAGALAFYADQKNWDMTILPDGGMHARRILEEFGIEFEREIND